MIQCDLSSQGQGLGFREVLDEFGNSARSFRLKCIGLRDYYREQMENVMDNVFIRNLPGLSSNK